MNNTAFLEGSEYEAAIRKMTQAAILDRVRQGATTEADADQLFKWLNPPTQWRILGAYFALMCGAADARKYIARDLREGLAKELLADEHVPSTG